MASESSDVDEGGSILRDAPESAEWEREEQVKDEILYRKD
jgi:hypothetical protein